MLKYKPIRTKYNDLNLIIDQEFIKQEHENKANKNHLFKNHQIKYDKLGKVYLNFKVRRTIIQQKKNFLKQLINSDY